MKRKVLSLLLVGLFMFVLAGCTSWKSYTYNVETGDRISIKIVTNDGYDLTSALPFTIKKDDKVLSTGTFIKGPFYEQYVTAAKANGTILDEGEKGEIEYVFYNYQDREYNYIIKVKNSNTALLIGNPDSEEEAREVFDKLTITLGK